MREAPLRAADRGPQTVPVGPARVLDATLDEVIVAISRLAAEREADREDGPGAEREDAPAAEPEAGVRTVYALHVGGINLMAGSHQAYVDGLRNADLVYADGAAVVFLAKVAGARRIERAATTDIGLPVLAGTSAALGRPVRVALVGGPVGLAERAGAILAARVPVEVVFATDGFRRDEEAVAAELRSVSPDVIIVGMGAPAEVEWVERLKPLLPPATVLTCGGWFTFLVGDERRAPGALQRLNLEWSYRLLQAPKRLFRRYLSGVWNTLRFVPQQRRYRRSREQSE